MSLADEIRDDRPGMTAADRLERIHADARAIAAEVPELVVTIEPASAASARGAAAGVRETRILELEQTLETERLIAKNAIADYQQERELKEQARVELEDVREEILTVAAALETTARHPESLLDGAGRYVRRLRTLGDGEPVRAEDDDAPAADDGAASAAPPTAPAAPEARVHCTRARTDMTPCVVADGDVARDDDGDCVGCGLSQIPELRGTARDATGAPATLQLDDVRAAIRALQDDDKPATLAAVGRRLRPGSTSAITRTGGFGKKIADAFAALEQQSRISRGPSYKGAATYEATALEDQPAPPAPSAIPAGTRMPSGTRAGGHARGPDHLSPRTRKSVAKAAEEAGALEGTRPPIRSLALQTLAEGKLTMPEIAKALDLPPALAAQEISLLQRAEPEPLVEKQFDKYAITDAGRRELQR